MKNLQKIAKNENFYENEDSQTCIKMSIKPDLLKIFLQFKRRL